MNEILLNKKISVERCIQQIDAYYAVDNGLPFATDYLKQDAIAMNVQLACELTIDVANYIVRTKKLGLPQDSRESFALLQQAGLITIEQMKRLQGMVGFRNTLVHQYQKLNLQTLVEVIEHRVRELLDFANAALSVAG
ncbi:MAG: DUF86 domain-containing protein [Candidatus Coatesbacteria bacterium]|nr:DUF86 domain-containing protein [Candidatus Coatesbacteria bacterium]